MDKVCKTCGKEFTCSGNCDVTYQKCFCLQCEIDGGLFKTIISSDRVCWEGLIDFTTIEVIAEL
jgi:hypothetical protein